LTTAAYIVAGVACVIVLAGIVGSVLARSRRIPCQAWLAWLVELDNPFTRTHRADVIIERSDVRPGMTVLDLGCGPGRLTVPLARRVGTEGQVIAVDIQEPMLDRAREKVRAAGIANVQFVRAAAGQGDLGRDRFDRAFLVTVLGEIPDRDAALKEIFAALQPGGLLSVTEVIFDPHFQTCSSVVRRAEAAGFREAARHGNRVAFTLLLQKPDAVRP
jgi:2-polyprenyl-3-methyl-5-hydroxy-6-metoxy-1,4-benzoquinol methylase